MAAIRSVATFLGLTLALSPALAQKNGAPLASHRATYELTLLKSTGSKAPSSARGKIAFDFSGSPCDGYTQEFRQYTEIEPTEGESRVSDMRSTTFEDGVAFGRLVGDGFESELPQELEGPDALPDLLVRLLLESGVTHHPVTY